MGHGGDGGRSCTSHITAVDDAGNMVALTQTLLARFGSKVVLPATGILMNNGIAWFDPEPGHPNSLAPATRPLSNMCPVVATRDGAPWFALGASGGRKIVPAVTQLTSFLTDFAMDTDTAWRQPRIDVSGLGLATYDPRLDDAVAAAVRAVGPAEPGELCAYPALYACPNGAVRRADGIWAAATDVMTPWSGVATAEDARRGI
jgi:gamma-glutamyltranspeptidase/glutathione hydrolase